MPNAPPLRRMIEGVFPLLLERLPVLAVEEVALQELRRCQAHAERVDCAEYLPLVFVV